MGAVINPASPGGDGVYRNDDYADFDLYFGSSGNDTFIAPPSGMVATGEGGDDTFVPGTGDDTFYGGSLDYRDRAWLNDTVVFTWAPQAVTVSPVDGTHDVASGLGNDQFYEMATIVGSKYDDVLSSATAFQLRPGLGDDLLAFATGGTVYAESYLDGSDSLATSTGQVYWDYHLRSTPLALSADGVANDGLPGEQDNIAGATGVIISGGSADDVITGGTGQDSLSGDGGNDRVTGGAGDDQVSGYTGNDVLEGGPGADEVIGGDGEDTLKEGAPNNGSDNLVGGPGLDLLTYLGRTSGVTVNLDNIANDGAPGEGDQVEAGFWGLGLETIVGTTSADRLVGSPAQETLDGRAGNDVLIGREGTDTLLGGNGRDRFWANDSMEDSLVGGYGWDLSRHDAIDVRQSVEGTF